jgi:hypothetical protein
MYIILTGYGPTPPSEQYNHWKVYSQHSVKIITVVTRVYDLTATKNPNLFFRAL